jgi:Restriction endonuclease
LRRNPVELRIAESKRAKKGVKDVTQDDVDRATAQYPPADITPAQFEVYVSELLGSTESQLDKLAVTLHETIAGTDGSYDFDATVRYEFAGMAFLVLVEAKRHANPIKRELVQVLHQKIQSVGAHKGVMVSTAPYQSGALTFAKTHGIALVTVTEGRFTYETKAFDKPAPVTREEARKFFGIPTFVGHCYGPGSKPRFTSVTLMSPEYPEYVAKHLLGLPHEEKSSGV